MDWYQDWQDHRHAVAFDTYARLDRRNLIRTYEGFNDVRLLNTCIVPDRPLTLLEVGCATGEFYRYLKMKYPLVRYYGIDISRPTIARAKTKYPDGTFVVTDPGLRLDGGCRTLGLPERPEVVYARDVIPHQTAPYEFLADLIRVASEAIIIRCRTRDVGQTEFNPELSCQYHYDGWMPYIVLNLQELLDRIRSEAPGCGVVAYRNHMVLGGWYNRFVPKELYLKETGTAETAVGIFKRTAQAGTVTIEDRIDHNPCYTWDYLLKHAARQMVDGFKVAHHD